MTTVITCKVDPDRTVSWNIDRMVWGMFESVFPRQIPMYHYCPTRIPVTANYPVEWLYRQYVIWYDALLKTHPVAQLARPEDYK